MGIAEHSTAIMSERTHGSIHNVRESTLVLVSFLVEIISLMPSNSNIKSYSVHITLYSTKTKWMNVSCARLIIQPGERYVFYVCLPSQFYLLPFTIRDFLHWRHTASNVEHIKIISSNKPWHKVYILKWLCSDTIRITMRN